MLVQTFPKGDQLWIVTKDRDYSQSFEGRLYLNPVLHNELVEKGVDPDDIQVFNNLSDALTSLNESGPIDNLPSETILEQAKQDENVARLRAGLPAGACHVCHTPLAYVAVGWRPSQYVDGLTWQWVCRNCGDVIDSGESADD